MKKLLSNKGNAELATSAVALSATLMIILVGYMLTEQSVTAEVSIAAESRSQQFNSVAGLNTLFTYKENHQEMIKYNYPSENTELDPENFRDNLKESLSYLKEDTIEDYTGNYIVKITNPGDELLINESEGGLLFRSTAIVASPRKNQSTATVRINAY